MSDSPEGYHPKSYWGNLVSGNQDLSHVGHETLGVYNRYAYQFRLRAFRCALEGVSLKEKDIFEAAYGEGFYLKVWELLQVKSVSGLDISQAAQEAAKIRHPHFNLKQGDLSDEKSFMDFEQIDFVTAIDVLYHIVDDEKWQSALKNLLTMVKPGGHFLFTEKFPNGGEFQNMPIVRRRSVATWEQELHKHGFRIVKRVPAFVFMDDPITNGAHPFLGALSGAQWRIFTKLIRMTKKNSKVHQFTCGAIALFQFLPEIILVNALKSVPNLEYVLCEKQ